MAKQRGIPQKAGVASPGYPALLQSIKQRIRAAQTRAALAANAELLHLYWDIGRTIAQRQKTGGWGSRIIPRLSRDLHAAFPEVKGFSERNIGRMIAFFRAYPELFSILPAPLAKLPDNANALRTLARRKEAPPLSEKLGNAPRAKGPMGETAILPALLAKLAAEEVPYSLVLQIPWAHHVVLLEKIKDSPTRLWYIRQILAGGWSHRTLASMIDRDAHVRTGKAVTNFAQRMSPAQSDLATQTLKDPYILDFLTLQEPFHERELETEILCHVEKFLLELGQGFAFVGRQFRMSVGGEDYSIDLLFYHLRLRCYIVIDLKKGAFAPEYAGKMNFYCNIVDAELRHPHDAPTIGLILCQDKKRLIAEYALKGLEKAIGVSEYQLTRTLPARFKSSLPTIEQIEEEISHVGGIPPARMPRKKNRKRR